MFECMVIFINSLAELKNVYSVVGCSAFRFFLRNPREGSVPSHWFVDGHLLIMSSHCVPSVCACVQISSSFKDTGHIGLGPTVMTSF